MPELAKSCSWHGRRTPMQAAMLRCHDVAPIPGCLDGDLEAVFGGGGSGGSVYHACMIACIGLQHSHQLSPYMTDFLRLAFDLLKIHIGETASM